MKYLLTALVLVASLEGMALSHLAHRHKALEAQVEANNETNFRAMMEVSKHLSGIHRRIDEDRMDAMNQLAKAFKAIQAHESRLRAIPRVWTN